VKAVAEAHRLHPTQLYKWRRLYERNAEEKSGAALLPVRVAKGGAGAA
jgi:transposase-like protein